MAKIKTVQTNFAAGELSPNVFGREDRDLYYNGLSKARNVIVLPQGSVRVRPGSQFTGNTEDNQKARLISFAFSTTQTYLLVFTPGQFDVYRDGVFQVSVTSSPVDDLTADQIQEMNFTQSLDTLILVHPDVQPIRITRTSDVSWTTANISFSNIPQFDFGSGNENVWSATRGWPVSAVFFKSRLWLGGSRSRPQTLWGSKIGSFFDFDAGTALDDEGIDITLDGDEVNAIQNLFAGRTLQGFTTANEFFIPVNLDNAITPKSITIEVATRHGSSAARPVSSDGATIFLDASGAVVREFLFFDVEQSYTSEDISFLADHLIDNPLRVGLQKSTLSTAAEYVYFVNQDGTIAVLNRRRAQNFLAYTLWETNGEYEDIAVVGRDVYCVAKRTINNNLVRFIEKFDTAYRVDCGVKLSSGSPTSSWGPVAHLPESDVAVRQQNGAPMLNNETDGSGNFVVEYDVQEIEVGLEYNPRIQTMPVVSSAERGALTGEWRRMVSANIRFLDSGNVKVNQYRPALVNFPIQFNAPISLYTGWKKVYLSGVAREPVVDITQDIPAPFSITSMTVDLGR